MELEDDLRLSKKAMDAWREIERLASIQTLIDSVVVADRMPPIDPVSGRVQLTAEARDLVILEHPDLFQDYREGLLTAQKKHWAKQAKLLGPKGPQERLALAELVRISLRSVFPEVSR